MLPEAVEGKKKELKPNEVVRRSQTEPPSLAQSKICENSIQDLNTDSFFRIRDATPPESNRK